MFDMAMDQYEDLAQDDSPVRDRMEEMERGLVDVSGREAAKRRQRILDELRKYNRAGELSACNYADIIVLKSIYMRYSNYLLWLEGKSPSPGH